MKLFLASSNNTLSLLASRLPNNGKGSKVLFIANASDNHEGDKWWVEADRKAFQSIGCEIVEADLRKFSREEFASALEKADVIHFSGGSVLYLISLIKKLGFAQDIADAIKKGSIIYSGTSAGSMIASSDLRLSRYDDEDKEYAKGMIEFSGLGLVDFLIIPHTNNIEFMKSNVQMVEKLSLNLQTLIFLHDGQAIWVEDGKLEMLSV